MDALSFKSTTSFSLQHPPFAGRAVSMHFSVGFFAQNSVFCSVLLMLGLQASEGAAGCCLAPCAAARVDTAWSKQHRTGN